MKVFTTKDIAEYYNTTQIHYEKWWNLKKGLSLHYGIWEKNTKNFTESLNNTNKVLMELSQISQADKVLDAGCGVGGAALFLNAQKGTEVTGITLSEKQLNYARARAEEQQTGSAVKFMMMDYTNTSFESESFDVVWACESISSANDKSLFLKEAFRVLKKGGRLILSDFFTTCEPQNDPNSWIQKWSYTWGVSLCETDVFVNGLQTEGFSNVQTFDFTDRIKKSAKRMFYAAILGALPSELYNLFHPNVSRFAKTHYKTGYYQYRALKNDLWKYHIILAEKK